MHARFTALARAEFLAEISYYDNLRTGLGARFQAAVEDAAARAAASPRSGASVAGVARRWLLSGFPFRLVYTETADGILVHALAHNRRRPSHWIERLDP